MASKNKKEMKRNAEVTVRNLVHRVFRGLFFSIAYGWKHYRSYYAMRVAFIVIDALTAVLTLIMLGTLVNLLGGHPALFGIPELSVLYGVLLFVGSMPELVLQYVDDRIERRWNRRIRFTNLRIAMFRMCYESSCNPKIYEDWTVGEEHSDSIGEVLEGFLGIIETLIELAIAGLAAFFLGAWFFWMLAVFFIANIVRIVIFAFLQKRQDRKQIRDYFYLETYDEALEEMDSLFEIRFLKNADMKFLQRAPAIYDKLDREEAALVRKETHVDTILSLLSRGKELLIFLAVIAIYQNPQQMASISSFIGMAITPGAIYVLFGLIDDFDENVESLSDSLASIWADSIYVNEYLKLHDLRPKVENHPNPVLLGERHSVARREERINHICFNNSGFHWPGTDCGILGVNAQIRRGEKVAIVGGNGGGKTTLTQMMARLVDPTQGCILVNNIPLSEYDLRSFRNRVAWTPSSASVIPVGTIADFVSISEPLDPPDMSRVIRACQRVGADRVVAEKYAGYDSVIGSNLRAKEPNHYPLFVLGDPDGDEDILRGVEFSDGQAARLALAAREYLVDTDLYIVDEPTRSLDPRSAREVWDALLDRNDDRILLAITHETDEDLLRRFDKLIVVNDGQFVATGSYDELAADNKFFQELYGIDPNDGSNLYSIRPHVVFARRRDLGDDGGRINKITFLGTEYEIDNSLHLYETNVEINLGSRVALVGNDAIGRSTISNLLLRFVDPTEGSVLINGRDYRDYSLPCIRERIAWLPSITELKKLPGFEELFPLDDYGPLDVAQDADFCELTGLAPFSLNAAGILGGVNLVICDFRNNELGLDTKGLVLANLLGSQRGASIVLLLDREPEYFYEPMDQIWIFNDDVLAEQGRFKDLIAEGELSPTISQYFAFSNPEFDEGLDQSSPFYVRDDNEYISHSFHAAPHN